MIARHLSTEHDPFRRGAEFGREHRDAVHGTVQAYEKLFAAFHGYGRSDIAAAGATVFADAGPRVSGARVGDNRHRLRRGRCKPTC